MEDARETSNLESLFRVRSIPEETQIREVLDEVDPVSLETVFPDYFGYGGLDCCLSESVAVICQKREQLSATLILLE